VRSHAKASTAGSTKHPARRLGFLRAFVGGILSVGLFFALVSSASALMSHPTLGFSPITGAGTGVTIHFPSGVAVDESNGNVFLNDGTGEGNVLDIFGAEGGTPSGVASPYQVNGFSFYEEPSGVAVDNAAGSPSKGAVYVTDVGANQVKKFVRNGGTELYEEVQGLTPSELGFGAPRGAAVDSNGNVYIADFSSRSVYKFSPTGTQLARIDMALGALRPSSIALDAAGDLFVQANNSSVYEYPVNDSGELDRTVFTRILASGATGVAVNPETNELFIGLGDHVTQYDATTLVPQQEFGAGVLASTTRIAVNSATGRIYVSDAGNGNVAVFGTGPEVPGEPPAISEEWAEDVAFTDATLKAGINPGGLPTTYHVEYGKDTSYGESTSEAQVGFNEEIHTVGRAIEGLSPGTVYHYRFVATNSAGVTEGPDHTFTTYEPFAADTNCANGELRGGPAANLADCRAYEMVSPVDKEGGDATSWCNVGCYRTAYNRSSLDGEKYTFSSYKSFGDQASGQYSNQYISSRGPGGWITHGINAVQGTTIFDPALAIFEEALEIRYFAFSEDLSSVWLKDFNKEPLTPDAVKGYANLYRRDNTDGSYEALTVNQPIGPAQPALGAGEASGTHMEVEGVSADESHTVYVAFAALTPDAVGGNKKQLYDFNDGEVHLVSVMPNGEPSPDEADAGTPKSAGFGMFNRSGRWRHAVSEDGSRIYWSSGETPSTSSLFVRVNGEETIPVSSGSRPQFWTATPDGDRAIYSEGELLPSIFSDPLGGADLYEFDLATKTSIPIASRVNGVLGVSDDLSKIYFVSKEVLDGGATLGEYNVYLDDDGAMKFIATVSPQDMGENRDSLHPALTSIGAPDPVNHSSRVTPDGRHAAFTSHVSLTGYDNTDTNNGAADMEVYVYDANADRLTCASCNPTGARPVGGPMQYPFTVTDQQIGEGGGSKRQWSAAWLTTEEASLYSSHALSDDGSRLFFNAFDALVPQDTNGVLDVYEWRAQGIAGCEKANGCISLISTGQSSRNSEFSDASPDGENIFFETASNISPEDPGYVDIYDARIDGGYPYTAKPESCIGDACQSPPAPPIDPTPASAGFRGAGDPKPGKAKTRCRARNRSTAKSNGRKDKRKAAKRCKRTKRGAGR
jgi:hypothetical protein